jgi:hypothetical protein
MTQGLDNSGLNNETFQHFIMKGSVMVYKEKQDVYIKISTCTGFLETAIITKNRKEDIIRRHTGKRK